MKWKTVLVIFVAGLFVGSMSSIYLGWKGLTLYSQGKLNDPIRALQLRAYSRSLHLREDQRQQVTDFLNEQLMGMRALGRAASQKRDDLRHATDQKIRSILTPEQRSVFDRYLERAERRIRQVQAAFGHLPD